MNNVTCAPKVGKTNASVVDSIYSVIDSKIQYLDYQTRTLIRPLVGENTHKGLNIKTKHSFKDLKIEEKWFLAFEKNSKVKKTLLQLRIYLNTENAMLVLSLLADDQLITFSQKDLEYILGISPRYQAA